MNTTISKQRMCVRISSLLLLVSTMMLIILNGCSSGLKLISDWQQGEINIDGSDSLWQRGLYYDKESDFVYGVRNNDNYIYVFLKTQNRSTEMQIMRQGLTVWLDKEDGKNQIFGIKYPLSWQETHTVLSTDTSEEKLNRFLDQAFPELEIIGPTKEDIQRFSALEAPGIRVKLARTRESLVYELRVPLKKTSKNPFAIEPISGRRIGIEFEAGKFNSEQNKGGMRAGGGHDDGDVMGEGNPSEGGGMGGGRKSHGGGNQVGRSGNMDKPKQVELWLSVQLANSVS